MKTITFLALAFVVVSMALTAFADSLVVDSASITDSLVIDSSAVVAVSDSTAVVTPAEESGFWRTLSLYNVFIFLVGIFEIIVRLYPTAKNYSILALVTSIINFVFPNYKKDGGKFEK